MPARLPPRRGRGRGRGRGLVLVLTRFLLGLVAITAGPCPGGRATIRKFTIDGPEDAASFARDVACDGGVFEAVWMGGTVSLLGAIVVGRGTSVTVRGGATPAVIDAGGSSRIFSVASNADLHLEDIILQNGWSEGDGGAIYAPEGAAVTCVRCKLLASQAQRGGGIYLGSGSTFFMAGPSAIISGNRAEEGGGVYGSNCTSLTMEEGSSVENNSAIVKGGGISLSQSPLNIFGDGSIHGNMAGSNGGGVFLHGSILTMDELSIIVDNRALAYAGGVVLEQMSVVTLRGDSSVVSNHADGLGGGLCVYDDSILYVQDNGRIMDNSAAYGGGVFLTNAGTTLSMSAHASIVGNSAANDGGGVYMQGGSLLMSDSAVLVRNSARTSGGGVYALLNCAITMEATSSISENSGTWGGGLFVALSSTLTMAGDSLVANNTADDSGGGIYLADSATMNMKDRAVITRNVAQGNGGGIFSRGSIYMGNGASVSHCEARNSGGGIYVFRGSADMSQESGVHHNLADGDGGGISIYWGSTLRVQDRSSIAGNAAGISGGGISIKKESRVELSGIITISENAAVGTGGGLAVGEGISEVVITSGNIYFSNNSAVAGGGAAFIGAMSTFRASEAAGKVLFEGNWGARGGAILADDLAQVHLEESVTVFRRNDAKCCTARNGDGGGGRSCVDVDTLADAVSSFGFTACCARGEYATLDGRCEECGRAGTIVGADCTALQSMLGAHESSLPLMGGYWSANDATPIVRACWVEGKIMGLLFLERSHALAASQAYVHLLHFAVICHRCMHRWSVH
jgi:parallel beta-helix repeat protein